MKRQRKIGLGVLLFLIVSIFVLNKFYLSKRPIVYPNFGISIPAGYNTHGIDVSRYQKNIDWKLVSEMTDKGQKISFAIIKATEGINSADKRFEDNWEGAKEHGLLRGAYVYFHPNRDGKNQATFFCKKVELESGDLAPVVDIEETNGCNNIRLQKSLQDCLTFLEEKYGTKPIIYTSVDFYKQHLGEKFNDYPLWAAHYEQANEPRIERDWILWQHNCKGRVNGIDAEVDFNVVNGSIFSLQSLCVD